jgi:hypothetical protein
LTYSGGSGQYAFKVSGTHGAAIMSTPFRKDELLDELRTILLFEGDHLILGRGEEFAESFLGFAPEDGSNYCEDDPAKVDLLLFPIAGSFDRGYGYAFAPTNPIQIDESEVQDLIVFMLGIPRVGGTSAGGELHEFMTPKGFCRRLADTVYARWKLEIEHVDQFSIRELALLANMTEGAVRNAVSIGELRTRKSGTSIWVKHADALDWLRGRKGFVAMPSAEQETSAGLTTLRNAETPEQLGAALQAALSSSGVPDEELDRLVGWSPADRRRWFAGDVAREFHAVGHIAGLLRISESELIEALRHAARRPRR